MKGRALLPLFLSIGLLGTVRSQVQPSVWWKAATGQVLFNYNPSLQLQPGEMFVIDSLPAADDYTLIVVFRNEINAKESFVWKLFFNEMEFNALTTQKIHVSTNVFDYGKDDCPQSMVTTVQQSPSAKDPTAEHFAMVLGDGTNETNMKVAEVMYFDHRLGIGNLRMVQTYLAIKYGITLGPVNLVNGEGRVVWNYKQDAAYHHNMIGIAHDEVYGLNQLQSTSQNDGSVLSVALDHFYADNASHKEFLPDETYCVMGDNNKPATFNADNASGKNLMLREWKVRTSNMGDIATMLKLAKPGVENSVLIICRDDSYKSIAECLANGAAEVYIPQRVDADGTLYFGNIKWDTDGSGADLFGFGSGEDLLALALRQQPSQESNGLTNEMGEDGISRVIIYPNPSQGEYNIDVEGVSEVQIQIFNTLGVRVALFEGGENQSAHFEGTLPSGNQYFVVVTTPEGIQTHKLIIK